jgi:diguanylate cyclase (GGDEF)-like protein
MAAGVVVARSDADRSRRAFFSASAAIASTAQLAIQHEDDLVVNAGVFVVQNPNATNDMFEQWTIAARVLTRYPELQALGFATIVAAADLDSFANEVLADPATPLPLGATFDVLPPGERSFYCFARLGIFRNDQPLAPIGYDYCAADSTEDVLAARDTGTGAYVPLSLGSGVTLLAVQTPVYAGGDVPATVDGRRSAFMGWLAYVVDPNVVLTRALAGHPEMGILFNYEATEFQLGNVTDGNIRHQIDLGNGWTIVTIGTVDTAGVLSDWNALGYMMAGIGLSVLLATLVFVLATGRVRALAVVSQKTDELRHQALHDALTGLPNRALIMDRIEQLLARSRRNGTSGATLFLDLDGFKNVNDTLGHDAGDRLLQSVAERLCVTLRDADTIGRMGGDEFVILVDGGTLDIAPELVAERVLDVMRQPFALEGAPNPVVVTASIGIAIADGSTPVDALRDADMALYEAKAAGRNRFEVFHPEMEATIRHRYELEFDLRAASEDHQFRLVYQPIYDLVDLSVVGVEALIRWQHPTLGEIQPDDFIPLLESSGQIVEVGRWVLVEACTQMAAWRQRGSDLMVSVNVSGRQLDHDIIVEQVRDALSCSGLDAASLTLEVTETALMRNVVNAARRLDELKALGVQIAIDDFGTGYSSLAYLQRLPIDCLKIDRAFTDALTHSPDAAAIVHTLVQLGKNLGLKTLAEGVETTAQIDHLRGQEVNEVQGFLLARPLDPETFEAQLLQPERAIDPAVTPRARRTTPAQRY